MKIFAFALCAVAVSATHYEDPKQGCGSDEQAVQVTGIQGAFCSPACTGTTCPSDVPQGVTATPQCVLQSSTGTQKNCGLICDPSASADQCGAGASCKSIQGVGLCTYDDDELLGRKRVDLQMEKRSFEEIAAHVNSKNATWSAAAPVRSVEDFKALCGTWMPGHPKYTKTDLPEYPADLSATFDDSLDWRTKAPQCTVISKIRDQSSCGSCWAFGSTETFEDRRCIATGKDVEFSTQDTAGCCSGFLCGMSMGCNGGQPSAALSWMSRTGVVTGGDYGDISKGTSCKPYELAPCAHHVPPGKYPACPSSEYSVKCTKSCSESSYSTSYSADKVAEGKAMNCGSVSSMMTALQKGPLSVAFTVYSDFPTYKSGVYKHTTGSALGGHAVELIGYGTENGEDYWLVKNSWNEEWGDGGTFKIARGNDECGIESSASAIDF